MKTRWLSRMIARPAPHLCLCLSEQEFRQVLRHLRVQEPVKWLHAGADATAHFFESRTSGVTVAVCLGSMEGRSPVQIACLIVHEAVHIWQSYCRDIGETKPGDEQEAYAIQNLSQTLMEEYAKRLSP